MQSRNSSGLVPTITHARCHPLMECKLRCCSKKEKAGVAKLSLDGDPVLLLSVFDSKVLGKPHLPFR